MIPSTVCSGRLRVHAGKRWGFALVGAAMLAGAGGGPEPASAAQNLTGDGVAVHGYDVVAYFTDDAAVAGTAEYSHIYDGATYWFSSAENRDRFAADPDMYAPYYGGYCAYGVAHGDLVDIDPEAFTVTEDGLFLNFNMAIHARWQRDIPGYVALAEEHWPELSER